MPFKNPFDIPPIRAAELASQKHATGEFGEHVPDPLADSEKAPPPPAGEPMTVEFTGTAAEYAQLWYASLFLGVVTLGLYSPWGKVALRRYLAAHTLVGGVPLAYHGQPLPILKGRLLAAAILGAGWTLSTWKPSLQPWLVAALILVAPWFLLQTLAWNARNWSWRGLRFRFEAPYREAAIAVLPLFAWPASEILFTLAGMQGGALATLVPMIFLALMWPWMIASVTRLRFGGLHFGTAGFALDASNRDFYKVYLRGMGGKFVGYFFVIAIAAGVLGAAAPPAFASAVNAILYAASLAAAVGYARGRRFNLALHRLTVDGRIRFRSTLEPQKLAGLFLRNAAWVIATLGLATPWRGIATLRERVRHMTIFVEGGMAGIRRREVASRGTTGEGLAEGLHLDFSL